MSRIGAMAQYARYGSPTPYFNAAMNRSGVYGSALRDYYNKQLATAKASLGLSGESFDASQALQQALANSRIGVGGDIFNTQMEFRNRMLNDQLMSTGENIFSSLFPLMSGGLGYYLTRKYGNQYRQNVGNAYNDYINRLYGMGFSGYSTPATGFNSYIGNRWGNR